MESDEIREDHEADEEIDDCFDRKIEEKEESTGMIRARRKSPWQRRRRPKNSASSRKSCSEEGCTTLANRWGLCSKHGGVARCSEEG